MKKNNNNNNTASYNRLNNVTAAEWLQTYIHIALSAIVQLNAAGVGRRGELAGDAEGTRYEYAQTYMRLGVLGIIEVTPLGGKDVKGEPEIERTYRATAVSRRLGNMKSLTAALRTAGRKAA